MSEDKKYPAQLNIKYNDKSNRVTVFFRLFLILPIVIIFALLSGFSLEGGHSNTIQIVGGFLFFSIMLMIVVRQKYPRWWFNYVYALTKFSYRIWAYAMLLTDKYPSTDEDQDVELTLEYPEVKEDLNRYLPLIKWLLAIPHFVVLIVIAMFVMLLPIVWLIVLIMGKMPKKLFDFLVGYMRYNLKINAYAVLLITDEYPPFSGKK